MKVKFTFFMLLVGVMSFAQNEQYSRTKILLQGRNITELYQLGLDVEHGIYGKNQYLINDFSASELTLIAEHGFQYEVLIQDVQQHYIDQNSSANVGGVIDNSICEPTSIDYKTPDNFTLGSTAGYFTYQEMLDNLDSMAAKYPNLISARQAVSSTLTHDGNTIYWLRISDNPTIDESEPEALYTALHHAREPGSLSQMIFYMWYLLENYNADPEIKYLVDNTEMYFIPCVNPDGYIYNEVTNPNGGGLWRKNRRNNGGSYGVDLNRNYGHEWAYDNTGSSPNPNSSTYRGPSAFSEPETQNVRDFTAMHQFKIALNYHTYGNLLIYPWGYSDAVTPDSTAFIAFSQYMIKENSYLPGTGLETVGYTVNGDSDDFMYGDTVTKNKIISLTPEAGSGTFGFWPPINEIEAICKENVHQNLAVPRLLLNFGLVTDLTDNFIDTNKTQIHYNIQRLGFESGNLTVSLTPLTGNIQSAGGANVHTLNQFQEEMDSIALNLGANIQSGDSIIFVLSVDNGSYITNDTIRKVYGGSSSIFTDNGNSLSNWIPIGTPIWATTTNQFYTAPSSITDSPGGDYPSNANSSIVSVSPIDLTNAVESAKLRFWAKWEIEAQYDYAQVSISSDGLNYTPLCGKYSVLGTSFQDEDEPLYDGNQSNWVQEEIDISGYLGEQVYIMFSMVADNFVERDGFYVDEVAVWKFDSLTTSIEQLSTDDFVLTNHPNPAQDYTIFNFEGQFSTATPRNLVVYNSVGQVIYRTRITTNQLKVDTSKWLSGMYYYRLEEEGKVTRSEKMIIVR